MDLKLQAIQQANYEAVQLSDGFSTDQLTHQPLSSARAHPGASSEISIQELAAFHAHGGRRGTDGASGE